MLNKGNDNILNNPTEAGRKGGKNKKGKKHKFTEFKEIVGPSRADAIREQLEANIYYFTHHEDEKVKLDATKAFTDYYKPRKKESTIEMKGTINLIVNEKIAAEKPKE